MKASKRILAVAGLAVVGLLGIHTHPASAAAVGGGVFLGAATTPSLFSPVSPNCQPHAPIPWCSGHSGPWVYATSTGVGAAVSTGGSPSTHVAGPILDISASGFMSSGFLPNFFPDAPDGAWCGWSTGSGVANWSFTGALSASASPASPGDSIHGSTVFHWTTSAASVAVVTGETPGLVAAVVEMVPPTFVWQPNESCLNGNATTFTIVGAAVLVMP